MNVGSATPSVTSTEKCHYSRRMKGGFLRFKGKEISLVLIVLICGTIVLWAWERTPHMTTLLPPNNLIRVSPEVENKQVFNVVENVDSESFTHHAEGDGVGEQKNNVGGGNVNRQGHVLDVEGNQVLELGTNVLQNSSGLADGEAKPQRIVRKQMHGQIGREENSKGQEHILDMAAPRNSANSSLPVIEQDLKSSVNLKGDQGCNYAKGKWVTDDSHQPLYSGFGCKQWLSTMWACRLMKRKDFTYEKLRWQPKNCQMEEFEGSKFLRRLRDKTIAIVGDSLGRQQFQSLMCMITGGEKRLDVIDVGWEYRLIKPHGGVRPDGWAYRFPSTNTTVLYYWSACLCGIEPINITNPATDYAMHLDRPPSFLQQYLHKLDVLVLNTGHHWNRGKLKANRWVMYAGGKPNMNRKLAVIGNAKNFTIHSIVHWVNSQLPKYPHLKVFYRSISPRHFVNGDWNTGGGCDDTTPLSIGKEVLQDESSDYGAGSAVKGTGVNLLDITALSQLREEGHISKYSITASAGVQDCLHWCLPGVPDTWNEILFAQISSMPSLNIV